MFYNSLILENGNIYIDIRTAVRSISIRNGIVESIGQKDISGAKKVDLQGKTVIPAMTDAHCHFSEFSIGLSSVDFRNTRSLQELRETLREKAVSSGSGEWIEGGRWNHNYWPEERTPVRQDIDSITPSNPVLLYSREGHQALANTAALKLAGLDRNSANPPGGKLERDAYGELTGLLVEEAVKTVRDIIPPPSPDAFINALRKGAHEFLKFGITSVHDFGTMRGLRYAAESRPDIRIYKILEDTFLDEAIALGLTTGFGNDMLRAGHFKIFADGALGSQTAWTTFDYEKRKGYRGIPIHSEEELDLLFAKASSAGIAVAAHAIGDKACSSILSAAEKCGRGLRHRIEHFQLAGENEIKRASDAGVVIVMQPVHIPGDISLGDRWWGSNARNAFPCRSIIDSGIPLAFSSDAPIAEMDPFKGIHAAVTRCREDGTPDGGWYPEQRVTVAQALHAYTAGGAFAAGEEKIRGTLHPGKQADFAVLSKDILALSSADEIPDIRVEATVLGGRVVYGNLY